MGIGTAVSLLGLGKAIYDLCTARLQHKGEREKLYSQRQDRLLVNSKAQKNNDRADDEPAWGLLQHYFDKLVTSLSSSLGIDEDELYRLFSDAMLNPASKFNRLISQDEQEDPFSSSELQKYRRTLHRIRELSNDPARRVKTAVHEQIELLARSLSSSLGIQYEYLCFLFMDALFNPLSEFYWKVVRGYEFPREALFSAIIDEEKYRSRLEEGWHEVDIA